MTNNVVKINQVAKLFKSYSDAMCNSTTRELARNKSWIINPFQTVLVGFS